MEKKTEGLTVLPFGVPSQAKSVLTPVTRLLSVKTCVTWFTCDVNSHSQTSEVIQGALSNLIANSFPLKFQLWDFWEQSHFYFSIHWFVWFFCGHFTENLSKPIKF